jgi:uncharacterized cupredoxin-like copper-binding protein
VTRHARFLLVPALAAVALPLAACSSKSSGGDGAIAVTASDKSCKVAKTELAAGSHTFAVTNKGNDVTEVYVYAKGDRVVGEVENIGPGTSRDLDVDLGGGTYEVACKPGMKGDGIRTQISVSGKEKAVPVPSRTVAVEAFDYGYNGLADLTIEKGTTVEFTLRNTAPELEHELEVLKPDGKALGEIGPTKPGKTGSVVLTFSKPGTYMVECGIDDHLEHGMKAKLTVT